MASSQVEIASSSPFGCVLRDHNRRDRFHESNARAAFQKNLKEFVRDHLHTCISISSSAPARDSDSASHENSQNHQINNLDCWVGNEQRNNHRNIRFTTNNSNNNNTNREDSEAVSRRESRILDRWATRQAREMITTIERQSHQAELVALSNSQTVSSRASTFLRENSPAQSDGSVEIPNLGTSTLVQRWRDFEAEATLNKSNSFNSNSAANSSRTNSGLSCAENASSVEEPSRAFEVCNSADERFEAPATNEDSFTDWESDRTAPSEPPSSDAGESERVRVADIIRRLTSTSWSNEIDHEQHMANESPIMNSPRIRGRQAFADLLMQMERDRQRELDTLVERRAVSRFSQRGRIQSLLRLRFLQRGVAVQDQRRSISTASESGRLPQGSTITLLRERFSAGVEHAGGTALSGAANSRSPPTEVVNNTLDLENSSTSMWLSEDIHLQEGNTTEQQSTPPVQHSVSYPTEDLLEVASNPSSDVMWQGTSFEVSNLDSQETADTTSSNGWDRSVTTEEEEANNQQLIGTNYDWLSDISRPRRDWEGRRQAWYQEMLDTNSDNEEIRQLLERRRVSTSLASDFRERMDQLMMSYLRRQTHPEGSQGEEEEEEREEDVDEEEDEEEEDDEEEDEDEESPMGRHYHQVSDYFNQTASSLQLPSPSLLRSWDHYRDHEVGNDSDRVAAESLQLSRPSQSYYQDTPQHSSFASCPSIEMELIYDLRGHMVQLHHEMSELRKSIKSCMDMQVTLQHSFKQEVSVAETHPVQREDKKTPNRAPRKGSCCICYEMQVDSLLYRCGHMCTCLKCAHELQWSSGKCPICRAPIVDVVRAYADS